MPAKVLGVIPARFASSRFPGKALATLAGKTILEHVFERSRRSRFIDDLVVATDDERIREAALGFGAAVTMTRADHLSGTDRVAEVAAARDAALVVNIQGDEPLIDPSAIDTAIRTLLDDESVPMSTLKKRIEDPGEITNPNVVKVVTGRSDLAIYFSRCPIPYDREGGGAYYKHIGLYVYRRDLLLRYSSLPVGPLERAERLEQLRALENGYSIRVAETGYESLGVDTPEDLEKVAGLFEQAHSKV